MLEPLVKKEISTPARVFMIEFPPPARNLSDQRAGAGCYRTSAIRGRRFRILEEPAGTRKMVEGKISRRSSFVRAARKP